MAITREPWLTHVPQSGRPRRRGRRIRIQMRKVDHMRKVDIDNVERLSRPSLVPPDCSVDSRHGALIDLGHLHDARVMGFLLRVLADRREPTVVRADVLKRLRDGDLRAAHRPPVAAVIMLVISDPSSPALRLHCALALAQFTDVAGVRAALGAVALGSDRPIDLRYLAYASLKQAGPTAERVSLLQRLSTDETLGRCARKVLASWHLS